MMKGIDISHWNNVKDYAAIKNSGIDFVIINAGGMLTCTPTVYNLGLMTR